MDVFDFTGVKELEFKKGYNQYLLILKQLVIKNVRTKYKNSVLGFFWSLLNPLMMMTVLYIVFSRILKIKGIGGMDNFAMFMLCGLLPWNYFSSTLSDATRAIIGNPNLIKQAQVPRSVLPLAVVFSNLVTFMLTFSVFAGFVAVLVLIGKISISLSWCLVLLPIFLVFQTLLLIGLAMLLSALTVKYRDVEHIIEVILPFWFYLTPIFYPISFVEGKLRPLFALNPMVAHVTLFRAAFLSTPPPGFLLMLVSLMITGAAVVIGTYVYYLIEPYFAERI